MRFSIIIVSWNAVEHLQKYLPSVVKTDYTDFEIIVADNASSDNSVEWVREHYPSVKIAELDKNYGYCGGNNRGAQYADGDILVFLNNDVEVKPDWLTHIRNCFESDQAIAAVQPKILSYEEPEYFEYAGAGGGYIDKFGYPYCRGRIFDTIEKDEHQYDQMSDILWASGAALAIRKNRFEWEGGFDEDFEFHMEEIDLCWRLINRGYRVAYCPNSEIYHLGGGSLPMDSPRKLYYNFRNNLLLLWKNQSPETLWKRFPVRIALDFIASLRLLFTFRFKEFAAVAKAYLHFNGMWYSANAKRKQLLKMRTVKEDPPVMKNVSIIWQYFVLGKHYFREIHPHTGMENQ